MLTTSEAREVGRELAKAAGRLAFAAAVMGSWDDSQPTSFAVNEVKLARHDVEQAWAKLQTEAAD